MQFSGPAARTATEDQVLDRRHKTRGTVNNCANGYTPWGTYLTCEENWAGYFRRIAATDNANRSAKESRPSLTLRRRRHRPRLWATVTPDTSDNLYGRWNTEGSAAPSTAATTTATAPTPSAGWWRSTPSRHASRRRSAPRWAASATRARGSARSTAGKPLVWYMGDDRAERVHLQFVSTKAWNAADINGGLAAGDKYMDDGKLYVAQFNADGTGNWLELAFGVNGITAGNAAYAFADPGRRAGQRSSRGRRGRRDEDGPPGVERRQPENGEVYVTLTNNTARPVVAARRCCQPALATTIPRARRQTAQKGNPNGHVVRFADAGGNPAATTFKLGRLSVRRALHGIGRRQPVEPHRRQRLLEPRRHVVQLGDRRACSGSRPTTAPTPT